MAEPHTAHPELVEGSTVHGSTGSPRAVDYNARGYSLAIMHGLDDKSFEPLGERVIEFPVAVVGAAATTAVFFWLTVRRLRRMDVP